MRHPHDSEQPDQELRCEERKAAAENDARDLPLRPRLAVHEEESTYDDGDERERPRQWPGEGPFEIARGSLPRRSLCEGDRRQCNDEGDRQSAYKARVKPTGLTAHETLHDVLHSATIIHASTRTTTLQPRSSISADLTVELTRMLGTRRSIRLRRLMRRTGLPPETLLDLALEMLEIASRKLSQAPIQRTAVGLGAARWRNVSAEERSRVMRKAAEARWKRVRDSGTKRNG